MWHASAGSFALSRDSIEAHARRMIRGVGDASLGEWVERERTTPQGIAVVHVRRRLTPAEQVQVGPVRDIRGTPELRRRAATISRQIGVPADRLMREGEPV